MQVGTFVALTDLDNIRRLVESLESSLEQGLNEHDVLLAADHIRIKHESFKNEIDSLSEYVQSCTEKILNGRINVVVIKATGSS
ncbi:hypothetical protein SUGI_0438110 [Cryptomeria japonica]|nr:hypothetical protein SUGI_0438110 [Cryptomeria japonica]